MAHHFGGFIQPSDTGPPRTEAIYGAVITVTGIATLAVVFRFVARRKSKAPVSYDDYSIVLALVFLYGLNIGIIIDAALWGLGKLSHTLSKDQLLHFQKNGLAIFALYFTTTATIKISLLLLYYRLFSPSRPFRIAVYVTAVIVVAWWIALFFANIFQCVPVSGFWDSEAKNAKTARCLSTITFSIGTGVSNLVTDVMVLCLPMPMVWSLQTTQKITLTAIFLLGFFVCAISIIRIVKLTSTIYFDTSYDLASVLIWTSVELSIGILSACLPIMRPLLGRWLFTTAPSRSKANKTPSAKKKKSSSEPVSGGLRSPIKGHFERLENPTYRDRLESCYCDESRTSSSWIGNFVGIGAPVAKGSYGDEEGTNRSMYSPKKCHSEDSRLKEARGMEEGVQLGDWPKRRDSGDWKRAFG